MRAQAMRSPQRSEKPDARQNAGEDDFTRKAANVGTDDVETRPEADDSDLEESELSDVDDDRWDAFILDDDGDPLPDYGDFWFPD